MHCLTDLQCRCLVAAHCWDGVWTKGYEKLTDGAYYAEPEGLLVFDLFPRNAIKAADGQIYPIDPVIQRITPEFGQFLREAPYTINLLH